ncbi:copper chaperone PCu(A)C [Leptospira sp. 2 VSF19]|uniref:Copper chaperone PCu(A)C n=1 Tax=Leptospira soteropolitanensis TaxID=2950025 RepID=A0AAW5V9L4_9LEPT|nr:copper chaperone PCu(A)C [Leptospira soteropolitanensis]MCW7491904.1 copper chaperone PCu(A)C [Leptospira soteropolitanensis]MCW7499488.1 copper chaperone PCu(A)C [Leptospira soteropolitanensis]MCW7520921.1 copper chaperone PCu(A)C [Leptospira soteropolitanensis]MCW7525592.1 copper chaperone PCu(A)C [Leptospira soteropolitanensis]MCW7529458.1 copper chaperone PCu(A)C [Leptospira soteropolitanensis]
MKLKHILFLFLITTPLLSKEVKIENAYIKYTSSSTSVVYLTLNNGTNFDKKLVQTKSNIADRVELYTMLPSETGMKMIPVSEIFIPKNGMTHLTPRGFHIMLFGIKSPLKFKESIPFRFVFSDGTELQTNISIETSSPNKEINNKQASTSFKKEEISETNKVSPNTDEADMSNFAPNGLTNEDHSDHDHSSHEGHEHHNRADMLAPAGIMNPHIHEKGKWMIDYRYMGMKMWGLQSGTTGLSDLGTLYFPFTDPTVAMPSGSLITNSPIGTTLPILSANKYNYMSVPTDMVMEMNMVSAMTSISDKWMIMFMVPAVKNKMTMLSSNFDKAPMSSAGIGDVSFSTAYRLIKTEHQNFFTGMGISLPTGSIDERDNMPMMGKQKVPYNMQPGVGTYSLLPQLSYNGNYKKFSWGAQSQASLRIGKNDNNYRFGNRYEISGWLSFLVHESTSISLRVAKQRWLNLQGMDATLDPKMDPQNDPYRQGGMRSDLLIGVNFLVTSGILQGVRFGFEYGKPFHQNLNGPQLATRELINAFASFTF